MCLVSFNMEFPKLQHPFTMVISGPTGCGKTYFVRELLKYKEEMFSTIPDKVVWCYGIYQPLYNDIPNVTFVEGLPIKYQEYLGSNTLFIIDDLMSECGNDKRLTNLFTKGSHHLNLSVIFITQNFFHKGKEMREVTLNAHYLILCKNRRDVSQIVHLGKQLFPRHLKFFQEVYEDATKKPFSYLFIDLRSETPEELRLRTQILPNQVQYVYQMKHY
ncbi:uncharacterized protein LOC118189592 [Stegodyphus dumicola]|uniref:uncharacterized protein LOC118189592 n=1 Tax=Stegodyphus dumicola TaxID=202533 RepID=UPI0015AF43DF|nr:uncharacterized protein LOC118189592 [Stegodyphus dumicola]